MMRYAVPLLAAAMLACDDPVTVDPGPTEWVATLQAEPDFPGVSGTSVATVGATQTTVTTTISGATPGGVLPWHIHFGTCADDQGIVGDAAAYPHLQVDANGNATAAAVIDFVLQPGALYMVNVHASPEDLPTIVACGAMTQQ